MSRIAKLLKKKDVGEFLQNVVKKCSVFTPAYKDSLVSFQNFNKDDFRLIEYSNFSMPPGKCFLFPKTWMKYVDFKFDDAWTDTGRKVLFGVRPCDAQSLTLLDRALKDNEFYKDKRNNTFIIVMGCNHPLKSCFCTSVRGGPFSTEGADIFISDIGNDFILEDVSGRLTNYLLGLPDAGFYDIGKKVEIIKKSFKQIEKSLNLENLPKKLEKIDKMYERDTIWQNLGKNCSNCGDCISICSTCHCCFILDDVIEIVSDMGSLETIDPCLLNIIMSSGLAGQVPIGYQRLQRRVMDKFYHSARTLGQPFCVGCGRCIAACVENLDLTEILKTLMEYRIPIT